MAGHSQFKNIMHRKGAQENALQGVLQARREITVAAKIGHARSGHEPAAAPRRPNARAENMPKDNIERAIKKAIGGDAENYEEMRYEGYGPGGVAMIVEALTDNRNRTAGNIRSAFTKNGGALGETGSVGFMFDTSARSNTSRRPATPTSVLEAAIDAGADDVESDDEGHGSAPSSTSMGEVARGARKGAWRGRDGQGDLEAADHRRRSTRTRRRR